MSALRASEVVKCESVTVGTREFLLTFHAVERFQERARPHMRMAQARRELSRVLAGAEISLTVPDWARGRIHTSHHPDEWIGVESEMLLFPVERCRLLTCYAQQHVGAQVRIVRG